VLGSNEKVFQSLLCQIFWKTKSEAKSAVSGRFLEMKKYSEKIEKSRARCHNQANQ
jgi:hypothetical protein